MYTGPKHKMSFTHGITLTVVQDFPPFSNHFHTFTGIDFSLHLFQARSVTLVVKGVMANCLVFLNHPLCQSSWTWHESIADSP